MDREAKQRLTWVKLYEETGNAGLVCWRCGVSRPTRRRWWHCYQSEGLEGLRSHEPVAPSIFQAKGFFTNRNNGTESFAPSAVWAHGVSRSTCHDIMVSISQQPPIHKYLQRLGMSRLPCKRWRRKVKRYQKKVPGDRVQIDT